MRTAIFAPSMRGGGAERVVLHLTRGLLSLGHEVDLLLAKAEGPYLKDLPRDEKLQIVDFKKPSVDRCLPDLVRYLRSSRADCLLSFMNHVNVIAVFAARLSRFRGRVVVSERNHLSASLEELSLARKSLLSLLTKFLYPHADEVVCVSKAVASDLKKSFGISRKKLRVIYNPIPVELVYKKARERISHPWIGERKGPLFLSVGRLSRQKNHRTLIRALSLLRTKARLIVLGKGPLESDLKNLAKKLSVSERVDFVGFDANPYRWMLRSDVFVLPSLYEGLPNVLIEALALKRKSVASDCRGGSREVLDSGRWGLLYSPPESAESLARKLEEALERDFDFDSESFRLHLQKFSFDRAVKEYEKVLFGNSLS